MKTIDINAQVRTEIGKKASHGLREEELVPCVVYGGDTVQHLVIPFKELRAIIYTPHIFIVNLIVNGKTIPTIVQNSQWHPVEEQLLHMDFLEITDTKPVKISIPVETIGFAKGVKMGGKLKLNLKKLRIKALKKDLPDSLKIDVTNLEMGKCIKVSDLNFEGLEILSAKSDVVVAIAITRAARAAMSNKPEAEKGGKKKK